MSNLSLNRAQASLPAITEDSFLQDDHGSLDTPLAAPKPFFGHNLTFQTVIDCHHSFLRSSEEAQELRIRSSLGLSHPSNLPQRIRVLEGRALAYSILEKEAEAELLSAAGENAVQSQRAVELSNAQASASPVNENQAAEITTLLPTQLPAPFFGASTSSNFCNSQRKQRRQLAIAAAHEDKAKQCLREVRNITKRINLFKEHGDPQKAKNLETIIEQLKDSANYHTVIAQQTEMEAHGYDPEQPGARKVIAQGNYELEFPVRPPSPTRRAQEIKNSKEDFIQLPKTKGIPLASVEFLENKKLSPKAKQQLPVAKKITAKKVTATFPKNIKLPEAKAQFMS